MVERIGKSRSISLLIWIILIVFQNAFSQTGSYFITNLTPPDDTIDPRSLGMAQGEHGIMYFTNKNGVLEFDGSEWKLINTPGSVYTVFASGRDVYAGGAFGFGKLKSNTGKGTEFELITNKPNIFSIIQQEDIIYFCNEIEMFQYSTLMHEMKKEVMPVAMGRYYTGLHHINGQAFIADDRSQLNRIANGAFIKAEFTIPSESPVLFSLTLSNSKESIIGLENGKLFRVTSGQEVSPLLLPDSVYIEHHGLVNATLVNNSLIALGTLKGGAIFIDAATGATKEIIDYNTGLPDNDVLSIFSDRNEGVWVAQEYGFSRIAPFLPFRSFIHYPGLTGNLMCVKEIEGRLFAGTSLGLYSLVTQDQYEDITLTQTQWVKVAATNTKNNKEPKPSTVVPTTTTTTEKEKTRKKLFGFLKRKKDEPVVVSETKPTNTTITPTKSSTTKLIPKTTKTTKRVLKSRQYAYKKIDGIEGKVTQLVDVKGTTVVAGLDGVFILKDNKLQSIFSEPVRHVFHSPSLNQLIISTFDDRTVSLALTAYGWQETHQADTLRDFISYIFEDNHQNIWLCGKTQVYRMEYANGALLSIHAINIDNPQFDETVGLSTGHDVFIAASGKFWRFNGTNDFVAFDSLPGPKKYFASAGDFWFNDGHRWRTINNKVQGLKLEWISMFPNLRYLTPTSDGNGLWLVTANNELYRFNNSMVSEAKIKYPLFLRDVRGEQVRLVEDKSLRLDQSENAVYFEFTQPSYLGFKATEFRYMVHGLTKDWSDWSNVNNLIPLPYLPPGDYQIAVQSRDVLGNESEIELVTFEVLPYYWKRWWFYAAEIGAVALLVWLSILLGRRDGRYQVISQILSLLTIILLIQFIETGINALLDLKTSPVIEFLIQLGITMVVFPVESKLQRFLSLAKARRQKF